MASPNRTRKKSPTKALPRHPSPKLLFKKIRQLFGWYNRPTMASALGISANELARVERGELPLTEGLKERFLALGIHPDTFATKGSCLTHKTPLDATTGKPLRGSKPFGPNGVNLRLVCCQLFLTISTALESTGEPGTRFMILLRLQQTLRELPKIHRLDVQPPVNVIELHHAAVALGKIAVAEHQLIKGMAALKKEPGVARKIRRRKGGWKKMKADSQALIVELRRDYQDALARSGREGTHKLAQSVLYYGLERLLVRLRAATRTEDSAEARACSFYQRVMDSLPMSTPPPKPPSFIDPDWLAEDLFSQIIRR